MGSRRQQGRIEAQDGFSLWLWIVLSTARHRQRSDFGKTQRANPTTIRCDESRLFPHDPGGFVTYVGQLATGNRKAQSQSSSTVSDAIRPLRGAAAPGPHDSGRNVRELAQPESVLNQRHQRTAAGYV